MLLMCFNDANIWWNWTKMKNYVTCRCVIVIIIFHSFNFCSPDFSARCLHLQYQLCLSGYYSKSMIGFWILNTVFKRRKAKLSISHFLFNDMTDVHNCFGETKSSKQREWKYDSMRESAANAQCPILKIPENGKRMKNARIFQVLYTICSLPNVMVFVFRLFLLIFKFQKIPHHIRDFGLTMIYTTEKCEIWMGKNQFKLLPFIDMDL